MAKGKKTGGAGFQPGNKYGRGAILHNKEVKMVRKLTREEIADIVTILLTKSHAEVQEMIKDPTLNIFKSVILGQILAARKGNSSCFNAVLDRLVGKVPVNLDHTSKGEKLDGPQVIVMLPAKD